ncbi:MAG: 3-isopropylmalate dehydratase small subunit [Gammaproteobacteria bacterium]|nr:3-isopropylmalate dehydratase small subunit [Gammaproteobacteria bacterium]
MEPIDRIVGTMLPLPRANVDTDQIMPKEFLKRVERTGYGEFLFHDWRHRPDGEPDPEFVTNRPEYRNARILLTGANFGSGSSREHAPWGLMDWGFQAIVAPSFADIFYSNCTKIGLLPVQLSEDETRWLIGVAETDPTAEATIDLTSQTVIIGAPYAGQSFEAHFEIDPFIRYRLLNGLDDIDITLRHGSDIDVFERSRPVFMPRL